MAYSSNSPCFFLSFLLFFCASITLHSSATDTLSPGQQLTSSQTLISKGGKFELGFFTPGNSPNYYVGIWYKEVSVQNKTYVWVANRDTPVTQPSTSKLRFSEDGNLALFDQADIEVWSTSLILNSMDTFQEAVLGDDGNFVLRNGARPSNVYWQSFDYPTDTLLPGARLRYDNITKQPVLLTSWKNANDPSKGLYSLEIDPIGEQYVLKWNATQTYWRSGRWNGQIFSLVPVPAISNYIYNYSYTENENETYFTYHVSDTSIASRGVMDFSGQNKLFTWNPNSQDWYLYWSQPRQPCYANNTYCGPYGVCNQMKSPFCQCIEGFIPLSPKDWYASESDFSGGCVRRTCGTGDGFAVMSNVILPENEISLGVANVEECKSACLNNCSCSAYAYRSGCSIWIGDLSNLQQLSDDDSGIDIYLTLVGSSSKSNQKGNILKVILPVVSTVLLLGLITTFMVLKKKQRQKAKVIIKNKSLASANRTHKEDLELPLFDLVTIATATNQFCLSNKIGQGGFGPVYKAVLPNGEEIAIKRLSKDSRQGLQEFMNEVLLIAKLQHRNLVKLLGCCIQGVERMLIYEYMPNKSLDFFIFDKTRSIDLNWEKRFNIIAGIARGLLYLHRDSRLRIIHRDLKASNVLLDREMNPKISDFGMARTFRGDQTEDNTRRVVGTYGYMPPEYAIDGLFSMKSDVFSFGVLVLELISGKKNRLFRHVDHDLNLIGHTWKLLNDNKALEIMDASIMSDSFTASEVLKCIQVGLLCVQKFPVDRPAMSSVLSMLDSDGVMLPWPKQPGFYTERAPCEIDSSSTHVTNNSRNEVTITLFEGR